MAAIGVMCVGNAMATVVFQDQFENNADGLHNRPG
jgi:hypothetical protein